MKRIINETKSAEQTIDNFDEKVKPKTATKLFHNNSRLFAKHYKFQSLKV